MNEGLGELLTIAKLLWRQTRRALYDCRQHTGWQAQARRQDRHHIFRYWTVSHAGHSTVFRQQARVDWPCTVIGPVPAAVSNNVRINAVCPAIVATPAIPQALLDGLPADQVTPMSTIIKCFDACADLADVGNPDWVKTGRTGETVEGNVNDLIWHKPPMPPQAENAKFQRQKVALVVAKAYKEKIRGIRGPRIGPPMQAPNPMGTLYHPAKIASCVKT